MKKNKTKITLSAVPFLFTIGFIGTAYATSSSLYISPSSLTKNVGNIFNTSVGVNAFGNKFCAVEGTIVFNNLSCQSITVADGVMVQSAPSCVNPHFLVGIPNCSTSDKTLFTASVKAGNAGSASVALTQVDVIGEGASVGSVGLGGNYTINAVAIINTNTTPTQNPTPKTTQLNTETIPQITGQTDTSTQQTTQTSENNLLANARATGATSGWAIAFWSLLGLDIIYALAHGVYHIKKKRKQK